MPYRQIATINKGYRHRFDQIWENYCLIEHYGNFLRKEVQEGRIAPAIIPGRNGNDKELTKNQTANSFKSMIDRHNGYVYFVYLISTFEQCISSTVAKVYLSKPDLLNTTHENQDSSGQDLKILQMILNSTTRDEIIEQIAEERVRSIFYGNPINVFTKDKCRMSLGKWFEQNMSNEMLLLKEIIARRNIIVHSEGRVDRKYIKETGSTLKLNSKVDLQQEYMASALATIINVSCCYSALIIRNLFEEQPKGMLLRKLKQYES